MRHFLHNAHGQHNIVGQHHGHHIFVIVQHLLRKAHGVPQTKRQLLQNRDGLDQFCCPLNLSELLLLAPLSQGAFKALIMLKMRQHPFFIRRGNNGQARGPQARGFLSDEFDAGGIHNWK